MELYWIQLFARRRTLDIQMKSTNFVRFLDDVSLKSSNNCLSRQWEN